MFDTRSNMKAKRMRQQAGVLKETVIKKQAVRYIISCDVEDVKNTTVSQSWSEGRTEHKGRA